MVRTSHTQSIVAYRTQVARVAELAEIALPEKENGPYTGLFDRGEGHSIGLATEARVNINPLTSVRSTTASSSTNSAAVPRSESSAKATSPSDEVTISPEALEALADDAKPADDVAIRAERLAQIRAEIEAGTYDTESRFEAAVERMLDKLV